MENMRLQSNYSCDNLTWHMVRAHQSRSVSYFELSPFHRELVPSDGDVIGTIVACRHHGLRLLTHGQYPGLVARQL